MRLIFMGTGEIALPLLDWLIACPHELTAVVTQPDKRVGRKQILTPPEVKTRALSAGIEVLQPRLIRKEPDTLNRLDDLEADLFVVMAYGQILPIRVLEMPAIACINLHASLLPRHRGASPIQAAIREGDHESGITVMHVAEGLDTGDIILQRPFALSENETGGTLHDRLAADAPRAMEEALLGFENGAGSRTPQSEAEATYAGKLSRGDGVVDWNQPAGTLERTIRAYDPWPGSTTTYVDRGRAKTLKIHPPIEVVEASFGPPGTIRIETGQMQVMAKNACLQLHRLQLEGKRSMETAEFLRGHPAIAEQCFPSPEAPS